jgi:hypothetical protein
LDKLEEKVPVLGVEEGRDRDGQIQFLVVVFPHRQLVVEQDSGPFEFLVKIRADLQILSTLTY